MWPIWAHPHSRGENYHVAVTSCPDLGSSPLTRGKHEYHDSCDCRIGLIPTHAGKTQPSDGARCLGRAHPHSRGENHLRAGYRPTLAGSSPLTRGKLARPYSGHFVGGLIPTHAGKTEGIKELLDKHEAHPHSRGEN